MKNDETKEVDYRKYFILTLPAHGVMLAIFFLFVISPSLGWVAFCFLPFLIGFSTTLIYFTLNQERKLKALLFVKINLFIVLLDMLIFGIDGIFCLLMMVPIFGLLGFAGWLIAMPIAKTLKNRSKIQNILLSLVWLSTPFLVSFEKELIKTMDITRPVKSTIFIAAPPETVWKNVVSFSPIESEKDWIFKTGISCPIHAEIQGNGVGATRLCIFDNGNFVEPVTRWEENKLLTFDVTENPVPMKETSIWRDIDPAHLHNTFESKKGQFKLIPAEGGTILEGTTWYEHHLYPQWYWGNISDEVIHRIHQRVLTHIKNLSEKKSNCNH